MPFIVGAPLLVQHAALNGDGVQLHGIEAVFWDVVGLAFVNDLLTEVNAERMTPLSRCRTGCLQIYQCLANSEVIQSYHRIYDFYLDTSSKTHVRILSVRVDGAYDHTQED